MIEALILDDEPKARINLKAILEEYIPQIRVIAEAENVAEALKLMDKHKPKLVFLDIELQRESGFDFLAQMERNDFYTIFTTAHDEYAIKAFKLAAVDYILKPIDIDGLQEAVERVEKRIEVEDLPSNTLKRLMETLQSRNNFDKIAIPNSESVDFFRMKDIIRFEAVDNYTIMYAVNSKPITVSKNIKQFEDLLEPHNFIRIHRSHLINMKYIKSYYRGEGGYVILEDETSLPVSRRKKAAFMESIHKLGH